MKKNASLVSGFGLAMLTLSGCGAATPAQVTVPAPVKTESPAPTPVVTEIPVVVTSSVPSVATSSAAKPVSSSTHTYKDGTYSVVGSYKSPAGQEEIGVTVTLKNDIITDVTVTPKASAPRSKMLQQDFAANYKPMVVGKNIAGLNLGKVSGASLTPIGFNDALAKIEAKAK